MCLAQKSKYGTWHMGNGKKHRKDQATKIRPQVVASSNDHVEHGLLLVIGCLFISSLS